MARNQIYPRKALINAITNDQNSEVTFTEAHDFTLGEVISFRVRSEFGMRQINNKRATILEKTSDSITVNIDSSSWDSFDYSLINTTGKTPPLCVPCCSKVVPGSNPATINIKDAFDNRKI